MKSIFCFHHSSGVSWFIPIDISFFDKEDKDGCISPKDSRLIETTISQFFPHWYDRNKNLDEKAVIE